MDYNLLRKKLILITWGAFTFLNIITVTQAEFNAIFTDIEAYFNPVYIASDYEIFLLDEGTDNQVFINLTIVKVPPTESTVHFKVMGATMGEYKINTGFDYHFSMCDMANDPIIFGRVVDQLGIGKCPLKIGNYGNKAYEIDTSTLPDTFPSNKYILSVCLNTDNGESVGNFTLYFTVQ